MRSMLLFDIGAFVKTFAIVVLAILVVFAAFSIFTGIWKTVLARRYKKYNKQEVSNGLTGGQTAEKLLQGLGLNGVKVEKSGWFSGLFLGNRYSPKKKTIFLLRNIFDKVSLTASAMATEKVAIAKMDHDGDKRVRRRARLMPFTYFAPYAVLPMALIGFLIDYLAWKGLGWFTVIFTVVAIVFYALAFTVTILNMKIEKEASDKALEYIQKTGMLTEEEMVDAKILYRTYIIDYVLTFINELLFIVWRILKAIYKVLKFASKFKK